MNFLLYNFGLLLLIFINKEKINLKLIFYIFILTFVLISSSLLIFDGAKHRIKTTLSIFDLSEKKINSQHLNHYIIAIDIFKDYPVFGTGHKTFRLECVSREYLVQTQSLENKGCATHPHNNYLEMMTDMGLLGLISFLFLISYIYLKSIKSLIHKSSMNGFFVSFLIIIWPLSTNGNFFNNRVAIMNFMIFGILLHFSNRKISKIK